ncbi:MAG TPA: ABC transporter permease [Mycobacteriales bacterium]|jgi:ABC-2 type transport system permease protein|nr:ABC transporter permease [Mycobacteriales bacterium]
MSAVDATTAAPAASARPLRSVSSRFFRSELGMVFGRRRNQVALLVLGCVPILIAIAVKLSTPKPGDGGPQFIAQITQNGVFVAFSTLTVVIPIFLPLAVAVVSGDAVAGEAGSGTLRYLLVVPVSRARLLLVKYASTLVFALAATLLVSGVGVLIGLILFPRGSATLLSGSTVGMGEVLWRLLLCSLYVAAGMAALAAIGLFISTLVEASVAAMATTAGIAIVLQVLDSVPQLHAIQPYLVNHWWLSFGDLLRSPMVTGDVVHGLLVSLAYVGIFGSLSWARFGGKDVSS